MQVSGLLDPVLVDFVHDRSQAEIARHEAGRAAVVVVVLRAQHEAAAQAAAQE